ncbi:MAG: penicillin-binding protein 2 [Patescibacteria group bacterium]
MNWFRFSQKGRMIEPEEIFLDSLNFLGFDRDRHEGRLERSSQYTFSSRVLVIFFLIFFALFFRVFYLQVVSGTFLNDVARTQSVLVSRTDGPRGRIVDRNGVVLAGNGPSFDLLLYGTEFKRGAVSLDALKKRLTKILEKSELELVAEGFPKDERSIKPQTVIAQNIDQKTILLIQAQQEFLPGILSEERFQRTYDGGPAFSQLVGYMGIVLSEEREKYSEYTDVLIGKLGLERAYNEYLRGVPGKKIVQINALRSVQRIKTIEPALGGATVTLLIDAELQKKAYEVLEKHIQDGGKRAGAFVAIDPRDGSVLALISYPSFDNSFFKNRLSQKDFEKIFKNPDMPLFNRAISGEYPPGSIIKPIIASAALEERVIDPQKQIFSAGFIQIPNPFKAGEFSVFKDWKPLGWMDIRSALAYSSNVYFYTVGGGYQGQQGLGIERIGRYEELFGLGKKLGIDLPGEEDGIIPSPLRKATTKKNDPLWRIGDTYNASIGQGDTLVTPLQIASYGAVFANQGTLFQPRIVQSIYNPETATILASFGPSIIRSDFLDKRTIQIVREGMRMAVTEGSARQLSALSVTVAGKTGTAETGRLNETHAWFTGFAPYENPKIMITVLVEKGGEGSSVAVPIAREILEWYFKQATSTSAL